MKVMTQKGFAHTRMDDIVHETGLSKGALYHHYEGKKDILLALIDHWETQTFPDFYSRNGQDKRATDIFRNFAGEILKVYKNRQYVFLAEVEFWALASQDDEVRDRSQELYEKILNLFELVINKGIREGQFKDVNTRIMAIYILTVFQGINWFCIFKDEKAKAKDYISEAIELVIQGLEK